MAVVMAVWAWVLRLMKPVIALEGYGGSVDLHSGIRIVGTLGDSSDIGAVEISELTVASVLMVCWSCWDWMICLLVLCSVVFDVEDGVMKDHQMHHHQKHHHKHCYAWLSHAPTVWSLLCLCTR